MLRDVYFINRSSILSKFRKEINHKCTWYLLRIHLRVEVMLFCVILTCFDGVQFLNVAQLCKNKTLNYVGIVKGIFRYS